MDELQNLKSRMEQERPSPWEDLPDIALYMDQLISYMPRQLIRFDGGPVLTSAMVNNYIKDGLVPRAEGKRYGPIHLGYLTAVVALKQVLSVRDIGALMGAGRALEKSPPEQYAYFRDALDHALTDTAQAIDPEAGQSDLAKMALDFAVRSYANQLACQRILSILQPRDGKKHQVK
jgi:hypothetical protein